MFYAKHQVNTQIKRTDLVSIFKGKLIKITYLQLVQQQQITTTRPPCIPCECDNSLCEQPLWEIHPCWTPDQSSWSCRMWLLPHRTLLSFDTSSAHRTLDFWNRHIVFHHSQLFRATWLRFSCYSLQQKHISRKETWRTS